MFLKNSFFVLLLSCLFACQQPQNSSIPDSSLAIEVDSSTVVLLSEFKAFENSFVNYLHSNPVVANEEAYRMKMNEMVYEGFVRASYQDNFLKILDGSIF